ncbi:sulfotransferase family protein [Ruegeria aquimaris]|uniref:Sulfotransferase family protein n=1 Tax=Ruegeria aquimaris TaxID=2984333 RepID=A0ABT3AQE4_9RHOB|nr:sulfotransferase family protein [Ruegeria sp. XHP0148]MCV2890893.1 sulfotransferase family protein [Ruegeria sp. XHP0148]
MPIIRTGRGIYWFVHVPKCAGTTVEEYLVRRFGRKNMGFYDPRHIVDSGMRWTRSSPQHVHAEAMSRLFPDGFLDGVFTVVRDPSERIRSVFLYQRDVERSIGADTGFEDWLNDLVDRRRTDPYYLDNHPRPMVDFVPEEATVFRLEDGLGALVDWLDERMNNQNGPREIVRSHTLADRLAATGQSPGSAVELCTQTRRRIAEIYAADYERFGYKVGKT